MSDNPYEAPQTIETIQKDKKSSNKKIPTSNEVLGIALFSVFFLVFSALMLDGGRLMLVAMISIPVMWVVLGVRWLLFRNNS